MKTIVAILLFISFSSLDGIITSSADIPFVFDKQVANSCPPNHEKAEKELEEYLVKESSIEDLRTTYGFDVDLNSHNKIQALVDEKYQSTCNELLKELEDYATDYSVYKVLDYYFVVSFDLNKDGEYEYKSISINNSKLEVVGVVINFSGTLD